MLSIFSIPTNMLNTLQLSCHFVHTVTLYESFYNCPIIQMKQLWFRKLKSLVQGHIAKRLAEPVLELQCIHLWRLSYWPLLYPFLS